MANLMNGTIKSTFELNKINNNIFEINNSIKI